MTNYTKKQIQKEISKLCADINQIENLITSVKQDLTCINDFINPRNTDTANSILVTAREQINIVFTENIKQIFHKLNYDNPDFFNDEDWVINVNDFNCGKLKFNVKVSNRQTKYESIEERTVTRIKVTDDDTILLGTEEEENNEYELSYLSTDEFADVAHWCEQALATL